MVAVPFAGPVAVGEKTTLIVQFAPAARVPPQLGAPPGNPPLAMRAYGAVTATLMPVRPAPPVLCRVRFWDALVAPTTTFPKASDVGVTLATATEVPANSTAPASTALFVFLGFSKKSFGGAALREFSIRPADPRIETTFLHRM